MNWKSPVALLVDARGIALKTAFLLCLRHQIAEIDMRRLASLRIPLSTAGSIEATGVVREVGCEYRSAPSLNL
jgi:hypothetical protein